MENVAQIINKRNISDFTQWIEKLNSLGYQNYYQVLNAKDYGVPQNRKRCFMVSILGDYEYEFPEKKELTTHLSDILEPVESVDDKYYLTDNAIKCFTDTANRNGYVRADRFRQKKRGIDVAYTITTRADRTESNYVIEEVAHD